MFYSTDPENRSAFVGALRELADFLAANPAVPVPTGRSVITLCADRYEDGGKEQVGRIARLLGAAVADDTPDGHYTASREFGQISYQIVSIPGTWMALYDARHSYNDSIILDVVNSNQFVTQATDFRPNIVV